ncbi:MAG: TlyA family RNA methyltransferase [Clostridiales bacterium]|nr:TlyA family RNA methyltransferase [Clostridiales bacterium]
MRADVFLYKNGIAKSRTSAQSLISSGVSYKGVVIDKPSFEIPEDALPCDISVSEPEKYVGRGGYKLEKAFEEFGLDVKEITAVDLGASTGGFTDCLLQNGAKKVYSVDVGHGQLSPSLLKDKRVVCMEGTDARTITKEMFSEKIYFICSDLSFISQSKVFPVVSGLLEDGGVFVSLIKPQFEIGRVHTKNGIVKDKNKHIQVALQLIEEAEMSELYAEQFTKSPIKGGDGNTEYLVLFRKNGNRNISKEYIKNIVGK